MNIQIFYEEELEEAVNVLRSNGAAEKVAGFLDQIRDTVKKVGPDEATLVHRESCLGSILWDEQDIANELQEQGCEVSQENIDSVLDYLSIDDLENCESGWDAIYKAIEDADSVGELKSME